MGGEARALHPRDDLQAGVAGGRSEGGRAAGYNGWAAAVAKACAEDGVGAR